MCYYLRLWVHRICQMLSTIQLFISHFYYEEEPTILFAVLQFFISFFSGCAMNILSCGRFVITAINVSVWNRCHLFSSKIRLLFQINNILLIREMVMMITNIFGSYSLSYYNSLFCIHLFCNFFSQIEICKRQQQQQ